MACRLDIIENNKVKPFYIKVTDYLSKKYSVEEQDITAFIHRLGELWEAEFKADIILSNDGCPTYIQFQNERDLTAFLIKWT